MRGSSPGTAVFSFSAPRAPSPVEFSHGGRRARKRQRKLVPIPDEEAYPQGLAVSCWFDSGSGDRPYSATIRFSGRRIGAKGHLGRGDSFVQDEVIEGIIPGTGPISITTRAHQLNPGEWTVTAEMLRAPRPQASARQPLALGQGGNQRLPPAAWNWRTWSVSTGIAHPVKTRWAPLTAFEWIPAVIPGSWPISVLLGFVVGLGVQAALLRRAGIKVVPVLGISLVAAVAGLLGAKAWFVALNLRAWRDALRVGLCIQGFLAAAVAVGVGGLLILGMPVGRILDASAPALLVGVTIGRFGCFFTGCCAGRPSASRWAIWSSDRRVGARRLPTQLLESLVAFSIGMAAALAFAYSRSTLTGAIFVAACAAYTLARQGLLKMRGEARRSALGGPLTAAVAAVILAASVIGVLVRARS
ncbi:MAG: hypothetical protein NVSMB17_00130 [Candidatus Dormibacteria bacterium]